MNRFDLKEYRRLAEDLKYTENEIIRWEALAEKSTRAPSHAPVLCGVHDPMPHIVDKLSELRETVTRLRWEMRQARQCVERAFERLPALQRRVMLARYIEGRDWLSIAHDMSYSEAYLYKLHEKALLSMKFLQGKRRKSSKTDPAKGDMEKVAHGKVAG